MMQVKCFTMQTYNENTYIVYDETNECLLIDCGCQTMEERLQLTNFIESRNLKVRGLLCTHCHLDHTIGNAFFSYRYSVHPEANEGDRRLSEMTNYQAIALGVSEEIDEYQPIYTLEDGVIVKFGNTELRVIHTPGHTQGSVCLYNEADHILISGDTLMKHSVGASNLPGGRKKTLQTSIETRLFILPDDVVVYSGHGEPTTIGEEKRTNTFEAAGSVREN